MLRNSILGVMALAALACKSEVPVDTPPPPAATPTAPVTRTPVDPATVKYADKLGVDLSKMKKTDTGLYWQDLVVGTGARADSGNQLEVHYVGSFPDGTVFDQGDLPSAGFPVLAIGTGSVVPGWDQGIPGMKAGGKRLLVVPSALGYGSADYGAIPGGSVLVFVVDLKGVKK